ncbi:thioredoxin domain-containing protein [Vibrio mediterranei]|uniref:thioredoxin domain-containing protein n=1 Tax=Vibrio mediterranei TaxID=689 RepID=UPI001EFDCAF8|nr:thioredoxin domain-containing protein [Vibrio mediterranei]MCG9628719.1 thioredoxin domain-containing protein [Vibrio mediterranei]
MNKFASFILGTMLASVITLAFVHYLIEPDLNAKAVNHVKTELLAHPEFLQQLADAYQDQQTTPQQVQTAQGVLDHLEAVKQGALVTNTTYQATPHPVASDAPVTVVEFVDYQCIYCSRLAPFINDLHQDTQLQFVFHETPIFGSRWPMSTLTAKVGNAVYETKGLAAYDSYHRALFATGHNEGQLTKQDIQTALTTLSLTLDDLTLSDDEINQTLSLFQALGFQGTPALIVMPTQHPTADNIHVIFGADPVQIKQAIADVKKAAGLVTP